MYNNIFKGDYGGGLFIMTAAGICFGIIIGVIVGVVLGLKLK